MNYQSTRSKTELSDKQAILKGIAEDGGLFVLPEIKGIDVDNVLKLDYQGMAKRIMSHLMPGLEDKISTSVDAYARKFDAEEITPIKEVGDKYVLELWHGPTAAFKDVALVELPYFIKAAKDDEGITSNVSILTATSGDTGKAALEGFKDVDGTDITVFFPHGGVSDMQRLQMVTQEGNNVRVCAVKGNFDDCQRGVKEAFRINGGRKYLSSANSINIGRLVPQVVYYFYAYSKFGREGINFVVPTGNFGDILAGYIAKKMGLPIGKLVCASNANNVLYDFLSTGVYDRRREFVKTQSPSMDILVSSNLERLLFYSSQNDEKLVASLMTDLNEKGWYKISNEMLKEIKKDFSASCCMEDKCSKTIKDVFQENGYVIDPHTAVAYSAAKKGDIVLSTASPFKFPKAVTNAIGRNIYDLGLSQPRGLVGLENKTIIHNDIIEVNEIVEYALS